MSVRVSIYRRVWDGFLWFIEQWDLRVNHILAEMSVRNCQFQFNFPCLDVWARVELFRLFVSAWREPWIKHETWEYCLHLKFVKGNKNKFKRSDFDCGEYGTAFWSLEGLCWTFAVRHWSVFAMGLGLSILGSESFFEMYHLVNSVRALFKTVMPEL